eukprot:900495-Rhodomonas_salina.2
MCIRDSPPSLPFNFPSFGVVPSHTLDWRWPARAPYRYLPRASSPPKSSPRCSFCTRSASSTAI